MRRSRLWPLGLILLASCSKSPGPTTLVSKWEKNFPTENTIERRLASTTPNKCLKDIFNVETLKAEIKDLEKKYAKSVPITGQWKHLDLSKLPLPQAVFLRTYGLELGDLSGKDSIDYSRCEDVPCIFNQIYGKGEHIAGQVHYLWYLKFNQMLSADNSVPGQKSSSPGEYSDKKYPLKAYLFSDKELYAFWRMSQMLKAPYLGLTMLREIQRVPRESLIEKYVSACGIASPKKYVLLADGCMTFSDDTDQGDIYDSIIHELTHIVDFEQGDKNGVAYRSTLDDYLKVSGFFLQEYIDDRGQTQSRWQKRPGIKLVSGYAGSSPQENFAETLAYFRTDGERAREKIAENHLKFVSKNYYQERYFDADSLSEGWMKKNSDAISSTLFKDLVICHTTKSHYSSGFFKSGELPSVSPDLLQCLGQHAEELSRTVQAKVMIKEPEACQYFAKPTFKATWDKAFKTEVTTVLDRSLKNIKDHDSFSMLGRYSEVLSNKNIAQLAYLECLGDPDGPLCFSKYIRSSFENETRDLNGAEADVMILANSYLGMNDYARTRDQMKGHYIDMVTASGELVIKETGGLWRACRNIEHDDESPPSGGQFTLSGYMVSSFYNCLNVQLPQVLKSITREINIDGTKLSHPKEEWPLMEAVRMAVVRQLSEFYSKESAKESAAAYQFINSSGGMLKQRLLINFAWAKDPFSKDQLLKDCKAQALKLISFTPLYHLKRNLFDDYMESRICDDLSLAPQFNSWLDNSAEDFKKVLVERMEKDVLRRGYLALRDCLNKHPNGLWSKKAQQVKCLEQQWPIIEFEVLNETAKGPIALRYKVSRDEIQSKLSESRSRLQKPVFRFLD